MSKISGNNMISRGISALLLCATLAITGCSSENVCNHFDTELLELIGKEKMDDVVCDSLRQQFFSDNAIMKDINSIFSIFHIIKDDEKLLNFKNSPAVLSFMELYLDQADKNLSNTEYKALLDSCMYYNDNGFYSYDFEFGKDNKNYELEILLGDGRIDPDSALHNNFEIITQSIDNGYSRVSKHQKIYIEYVTAYRISRKYYVDQNYTLEDSKENGNSGISISLNTDWHTDDRAMFDKEYTCKNSETTLTMKNGSNTLQVLVDEDEAIELSKLMIQATEQEITPSEFISNNSETLREYFGDSFDEFVASPAESTKVFYKS